MSIDKSKYVDTPLEVYQIIQVTVEVYEIMREWVIGSFYQCKSRRVGKHVPKKEWAPRRLDATDSLEEEYATYSPRRKSTVGKI